MVWLLANGYERAESGDTALAALVFADFIWKDPDFAGRH